VTLVYSEAFQRITDAIAAERQIKGWSRAKKEALIRGDFGALPALAKAISESQAKVAAEPLAILRDAPCGRSSG
jgi:putative endonuclease